MGMSAHPQARLTLEEYLELDRASQVRNEFYDGVMYAMSGGTYIHGLIMGNLQSDLRAALRGRCKVTQSDVRVRVAPDGLYTYPDLVVVWGEPLYPDNRRDTVINPTLLIEVLSPSTEAYDRGFKASQFRRIESLQEYALVAQSEARVEVFRRQPRGQWLFSEFTGLDSTCRFESVGAEVPLSEVYRDVTFDSQAPPVPDNTSALD